MIRLRRLVAREFRQLADIDLRFPPRGRILVQGRNEAGKSTLFEAIFVALFGRPLDGKKLDECVQYGQEQAWLELELELSGGRAMTVTRRIRATSARNQYVLTITGPDGTTETVQGAPVSERIEAELGLDGEALLNTCFVEQKKLEKLEGMGLREREQSLMKLLNLDRMVALADELKVTRADQADLQRLRDRLALADVQARLPQLEAKRAEAVAALARAEAAAALAAAAAERRALDALRAERAGAEAEAARVAARAAAAETLRTAAQRLRDAATARDRAREAEAARAEADRAAAEAAAARDALPAVADHGARLTTLGRRRDGLDTLVDEQTTAARWVEAADAQLRRLAEAREALNDTRRALVEARAAERDAAADAEVAAQDGRAFDVREALKGWGEAVAATAGGDEPGRAVEAARAERAALSGAFASTVAWPALIGAAIAVLGTVAHSLAVSRLDLNNVANPQQLTEVLRGISWLWPIVEASTAWLVAVWLLSVLCAGLATRGYLRIQRTAAQIDRRIARLEGEATVADQRRALWSERRQAAETRLRELNAGHPTDPARAAEALAELDARLGDRSRTDVAEALEAARETRSRAAAQIEALGRREAELRQMDGPVDAQALGQERASKAARSARLARFIERANAHLDRRAARLDVTADRSAIQEAVAMLRGRWAALREQAERLAALSATRDRLAGEAAARWAEAEAGWGDVAAAWNAAASPGGTHPNGSPPAPPMSWPQWSTTLVDEVWHAAAARIADAYATAGGDAVREAHRAAAAAAAAIGARCEDAAGRWRGTVRALTTRLAEVTIGDVGPAPERRGEAIASPSRGTHDPHSTVDMSADPNPPAPPPVDPNAPFTLDDNPSADALAALQQRLGAHRAADIAVLADRRDRLVRDIDVGRHEQARLATALGLRGEALDVAACGEALADGERTLAVRQHGHRIVDEAARSVVRQVLPSTLDYMRRLLPAMTDGRYYDARLTDDYRIETWDERAEAWQKKNLFSGGTKDQFSLALRLAFAMATLPEERGAAPSFLFLDEPLSAFDDQRAGALVQLLTEGEVAESFDQIFLISHVQVDQSLFDHRIVLEGGRVVEGFGGDGRSGGDADDINLRTGIAPPA